jgi:hypothetical protein
MTTEEAARLREEAAALIARADAIADTDEMALCRSLLKCRLNFNSICEPNWVPEQALDKVARVMNLHVQRARLNGFYFYHVMEADRGNAPGVCYTFFAEREEEC